MKGFTEEIIPEERYNTCRFCQHVIRTPYEFGMNDVKASYYCNYPENGGDGRHLADPLSINKKYIGSGGNDYRIETPYFCPYLQPSKD